MLHAIKNAIRDAKDHNGDNLRTKSKHLTVLI